MYILEVLLALCTLIITVGVAVWKLSTSISASIDASYVKLEVKMENRFDKIDKRFDKIDGELKTLSQKICQIEAILWASGIHPNHKSAKESEEG